jgi:hypothetical protein
MFNKKIFVMILSAALLSGAISVGAYKIFTKSTPSTVTTDPNVNMQTIVDTIDNTENLLDSNQVYKQKFENDLTSQGKWIPVKQKDFIRELTSPQLNQNDAPEIQNVANQTNEPIAADNTILAKNKASEDNDETFTEEVSTTNLTSQNIQPVNTVTETKTIEKIVYIWQPNECSDRNWNPYTNGHWEFTCAGWVWASDYSWGSHCYNYGRWMWTSFAGWVWMPGGRWAPNWVTWRYCGNYYGGSYCSWYPTCPVVYWQNPHHLIVCNSHFTSNPIHWTVVNTNDITKHIPIRPKVDTERNIEIINNSEKIKTVHTLVTSDQKIKYNGPNVNEISKITNTKITPKVIDIPTKSEGTVAGVNTTITKNPNAPKNPVKVNPVKQQNEINPVKLIDDITKQNVSSQVNNNEGTKQIQIKQPPVKTTTPITKTAGPSVNNPTKEGVKTEPPAKNLPPVKTPKTETPKQEPTKNNPPPVKNDPPKYNPPPVKNDPPVYNPPPVKNDPPPVYNPPPVKNDPPPVKNDPPPPPPVKQDPPKQDPPKQDPPPKKDDKKGD